MLGGAQEQEFHFTVRKVEDPTEAIWPMNKA
jgi:hypothetical protein